MAHCDIAPEQMRAEIEQASGWLIEICIARPVALEAEMERECEEISNEKQTPPDPRFSQTEKPPQRR
jgi:hypothetical protein